MPSTDDVNHELRASHNIYVGLTHIIHGELISGRKMWVIKKGNVRSAVLSGIVVSILLSFCLFPPALSAPPRIMNPYELIEATVEGGSPESVDPAWAYDTASGELIFNVYETLLAYDGESLEKFIPQLATEWNIENITGTLSPEGSPWHYRYYFEIRADVPFQSGDLLTPADVEYSFEREMVQDRIGGPQWMFYEPLLNAPGADELGDLSNVEDVVRVGKMIDHSVESNETHAWFNLAYPGAYLPFLQILCQTWSSVLSRQWIEDYVIGSLGRSDWDGNWGDYAGWVAYHSPDVSSLDMPTPVMDGTGPFMLETLDYDNSYWSVSRNANYWRGWPAPPYPSPTASGLKPAGYVATMKVTWSYDWPTRSELFLNGDVDFCAVPRQYYTNILDQPGIRCIYPLPSLTVDAMLFTFEINVTTPYGPILPAGTFNETAIPSDFFGNAVWGVHVRRAFASAFDYDTYINESSLGEGQHPATAVLPCLPYYDPSVNGYVYNLTRAAEELHQVLGLWDTGFTLTLVHLVSSSAREQYFYELLKSGIESFNPKFHILLTSVHWADYLQLISVHKLPLFTIGWMLDYPDPHDIVCEFYHSKGTYGKWQVYSNQTMDELIDAGLREHDSATRAAIYHDIQVLAVEDCPSATFLQPTSRHFERDWIVGWYYNPSYPSIYAYNLWKWYYLPHALLDNTTLSVSNMLPVDVNYDGEVNIVDVTIVARAFGASYGPPIRSQWQFRADVNNNREVNILDVTIVAKHFRETSTVWAPSQ